jgi:hypothetical protein
MLVALRCLSRLATILLKALIYRASISSVDRATPSSRIAGFLREIPVISFEERIAVPLQHKRKRRSGLITPDA